MTPLRAKMIRDMQLQRLALKTQKAYVTAVAGLAKFYQCPPDRLSPEQIRTYLHHLLVERDATGRTLPLVLHEGSLAPEFTLPDQHGDPVSLSEFHGSCLVLWWFSCFDPGVVLTTAPTGRQVRNILWKEIRRLSRRLKVQHFDGPKSPRMSTAPDHFAEGFTSRDGNRFQGLVGLAVGQCAADARAGAVVP